MFAKKEKTSSPPKKDDGKEKKPLYKKWWFWVLIVLVIAAIGGGTSEKDDKDASRAPSASVESSSQAPAESDVTSNSAPITVTESEIPEETPDIETSTELETLIWKIAKEHESEVIDISTIDPNENKSWTSVIATVKCPNDEQAIKELLDEISTEIQKTPEEDEVMLTIADIDAKNDTCIAIGSVATDGTSDIVSMSLDFNNERNLWIRSQFSVWDGSHIELEKLVKKSLNDEKSFKHIETTYRDISDESDQSEVNAILSEAGYSNRVEVGDLFIQMQFSAKNAFNATIKNTAFGIASYADNTITLVDIG